MKQVKCAQKDSGIFLTVDKIYTVESEGNDFYEIRNDANFVTSYFKSRFIELANKPTVDFEYVVTKDFRQAREGDIVTVEENLDSFNVIVRIVETGESYIIPFYYLKRNIKLSNG